MRSFVAVVGAILFAACAGPAGPTGPQGPSGPAGAQGLQGPAGTNGVNGSGTKATFVGTLGSTGGFADLPSAAGTMSNPPAYTCYLAFNLGGSPVWFAIGDPGAGSGTCALGNGASGTLRVAVTGGVAGQAFAVVVVY